MKCNSNTRYCSWFLAGTISAINFQLNDNRESLSVNEAQQLFTVVYEKLCWRIGIKNTQLKSIFKCLYLSTTLIYDGFTMKMLIWGLIIIYLHQIVCLITLILFGKIWHEKTNPLTSIKILVILGLETLPTKIIQSLLLDERYGSFWISLFKEVFTIKGAFIIKSVHD